MSKEVLDFLIAARKCPLGRELFDAENVNKVKDLMIRYKVPLQDPELTKQAEIVFKNKQEFITNSGFKPPALGEKGFNY